MRNKQYTLLLIIGIAILFSACVKENFDNPPSNCDEMNYKKTHTIKEFKAMLGVDEKMEIDTDIVICGTVTSNDMYGNFHKELIIEDDSGAIAIGIDESKLFEKYPLGQIVYVECRGLYLGKSYEIIKLGALFNENGNVKVGRIAKDDFQKYVKRTCDNNLRQPKIITIDRINDDLLYQFVQIDEVQFSNPETTWADAVSMSGGNNIIQDKNNRTLIVRTSGYASFARDSLPVGSGSIQGIIGKYKEDYQIYVNFKTDAKMENPRF